MTYYLCVIVLIVALLIPGGSVFAQEVYTVGTWSFLQGRKFPPEFEALFTEAYSRAGAGVRFRCLPMMRDLEYANKGVTDGSWVRTEQAIAEYDNLVGVSVPLFKVSTAAFCVNGSFCVSEISELSKSRVAVVRGDISSTNLAESFSNEVFKVDNHRQLFAVLKKGRVDVVLCNMLVGEYLINRLDFKECRVSAPLAENFLYHAVHARFKGSLSEKLGRSFESMFRDGTMKRLAGKYSHLLVDIYSQK